ncbi:MAG: T9SS type A sorting domain-containing protein [Bacteroidetes bacterium]|nr:T9SS type A sorting domain-containing protein [Bacteroidota bacterium]
MKHFCSIIFKLLLFVNNYNAQEIINSGSSNFTTHNIAHTFSVGELALIDTYNQNSIIITQGFLQPTALPNNINKVQELFANNKILIYPNPCMCNGEIHLYSSTKTVSNINIKVINQIGQQVFTKNNLLVSTHDESISLPKDLGKGIFYISYYTKHDTLLYSDKLIIE